MIMTIGYTFHVFLMNIIDRLACWIMVSDLERPPRSCRGSCIRGIRNHPVCLRRLLTLAIFLLPWAVCNAAPYQPSDYINNRLGNDTLAGTVPRKKQHHGNSHVERGCKHDQGTEGSHRRHRGHHRSNTRHRSRDNKVVPLKSNDILNEIPTYVSDLVVFSPVKPANPPWSPEAVMAQADTNEITGRHHRVRRRTTVGEPYQAVCEPDPRWVIKTWAYDLFGNNVTVVNEITTSDGTRMKQWFFQTTCKRTQEGQTSPQPCAGIDTKLYESECDEKRSFVYAVVRTERGEQGWNWVTITTSCNCAFRPVRPSWDKRHYAAHSVLDTQTQPTISRER